MGYEQARQFVAKWEGGLVNHPADPGGLTNYGISLRFLRALGHDVDGDGDVDADDIKALTPESASDLLKQEFWTCQDLDSFPPLTALVHFDASVNCGRGRACLLLQEACNALPGAAVKVDGRLGPKTRARLAELNDEVLALRAVQARQAYYARLVAEKPGLSAFIDGWTNRTTALSKYVQEVAHNAQQPATSPSVTAAASNVVSAPIQPAPSSMQDDGPTFIFDDVAEALQDVRTGHIQSSPGLAKILKALSTSKTIWGTVTLFLMVLWQYLGIQSWSDIGISIRGHIYPITDLFPYIAPAFATLATWGKVKQTVKGGVHA